MTTIDKHDFETYPPGVALDETDINLRAYFAMMDEGKLSGYDAAWTDEQVKEWDGNFTSDGDLFLVCSEREVSVREYREILELFGRFRAERGIA